MWSCFRPVLKHSEFRLDLEDEHVSESIVVHQAPEEEEEQVWASCAQAQAQEVTSWVKAARQTLKFMDRLEQHISCSSDVSVGSAGSKDNSLASAGLDQRAIHHGRRSLPAMAMPPEEQLQMLLVSIQARQAWILSTVKRFAHEVAISHQSQQDLDMAYSLQHHTLNQLALARKEAAMLKADNLRLHDEIEQLKTAQMEMGISSPMAEPISATHRPYGNREVVIEADQQKCPEEDGLIGTGTTSDSDDLVVQQKAAPNTSKNDQADVKQMLHLQQPPACDVDMGTLTLVLASPPGADNDRNHGPVLLAAPWLAEEASSTAFDLAGSSVISDWTASVSQMGELEQVKVYQGGSWPLLDATCSPPGDDKKRAVLLGTGWNPRRWLRLA